MSTEKLLSFLADQLGYFIGFFNLISGSIGNVCLILIFTNLKIFRKNQCAFYLTVESASNLCLLITIYSTRLIKFFYGYNPTDVSLVWCKLRSGFSQIFAFYSLLIICSMTFDQYLSTHHRYQFRRLSSMRTAYRLSFFALLLVVCHNSIFFISFENHSSNGCTVYQTTMKNYYSYFYYPILSTAIPFVITISFSCLTYKNVHRIVRHQIPIERRRFDREMTTLVITRVLNLIVIGIPFILITIYSLNFSPSENNELHKEIIRLVGAILYSCLYTNFSVGLSIFRISFSSRENDSFLFRLTFIYSSYFHHDSVDKANTFSLNVY